MAILCPPGVPKSRCRERLRQLQRLRTALAPPPTISNPPAMVGTIDEFYDRSNDTVVYNPTYVLDGSGDDGLTSVSDLMGSSTHTGPLPAY
jgi:hypothetical protein